MEKEKENFDRKEEASEEEIKEEAVKPSEEGKDQKQEAAPEKKEAPEGKAEKASGKADKNIFGKKKPDKRDEKIKALEEGVKDSEDRYQRLLAEFENFRRRSELEKQASFGMGAKSVIAKVLPVVDNFERGLEGLSEDQLKDPFAEGMNKVYQQLMKELTDIGVTPIEAVGKELDANLHNAVMQTPSEEYESGVVVSELQKGYMYKDSVVRHAMVAVAE